MIVKFQLHVAIENIRTDYYYKTVDMPAAPCVGLEVSDGDVLLRVEDCTYDIGSNSYFCIMRERTNDVNDPSESWEFMIDKGWSHVRNA